MLCRGRHDRKTFKGTAPGEEREVKTSYDWGLVGARSERWKRLPGVLGTEGTTVQCPDHVDPVGLQNPYHVVPWVPTVPFL